MNDLTRIQRSSPVLFSLIPSLAASIVFAIGAVFRWDGQAAILAFPFVLLVWFFTPVVLIVNAIGFLRDKRKLNGLVLILAFVQTAVLVLLLRG